MTPLQVAFGSAIPVTAAGIGVGILVRSVLRPNPLRAFKDYGTPEEHGLPSIPVTLPDGIRGWWAPSPEASIAVLLVHGRSRAAGWMYPLAEKLWPRASVMAIDLPGHGKSRPAYVAYGAKEQLAVRDAVDWLSRRQACPIVVIGVSMGGASAILAQANFPSHAVAGVVTIGTYSDIESVFRGVVNEGKLPWPLARKILRLAGKIGGFDLQNNRPVDAVARVHVPYLAIQGDHDELVPVRSARMLAAASASEERGFRYYSGAHDVPDNAELFTFVDAFIGAREAELLQ